MLFWISAYGTAGVFLNFFFSFSGFKLSKSSFYYLGILKFDLELNKLPSTLGGGGVTSANKKLLYMRSM